MRKRYELEIYAPGDTTGQDVLMTLDSDTPFMAIGVGDLLNPRLWADKSTNGDLLRVVGREHMIWKGEAGTIHRLCLFTSNVPDTADERVRRVP